MMMDLAGIGIEEQVASENLVVTFTTLDHLDIHDLSLSGKKEHGYMKRVGRAQYSSVQKPS